SKNLAKIFSGLPAQLSTKTPKSAMASIRLPLAVFRQVRHALKDDQIQAYLDSEKFQKLPRQDRLSELVNKILELQLPLESENLATIFGALPVQLSGKTS